MDVATAIQSYGYAAVAVGTLLEGESVLLAAGAAASRGYLSLPNVIALATLGGFLGDQTGFAIGRRYGVALLNRLPSLAPRAERVGALLERHHVPLILGVRFMYGLRIAGPIAIGMSGVQWSRFMLLNLLGALIWATLIASIGYGLGAGLRTVLGDFDADEWWLVAAVLLPPVIWLLARRRHSKSP